MEKSNLFEQNKYYQLYYRRTYLFAKSYVRDQWVAEDIASHAMAKLWETMEKKEVHHPISFLFSIAKNKSIDYLRREIIRQETYVAISEVGLRELNSRVYTVENCEPENIYSEDIEKIIHYTLKALPDRTREVFLMSRCLDLTKEEISQKLNLTPKGIEYHIAKALKCLRVSLKEYLPMLYFYILLL